LADGRLCRPLPSGAPYKLADDGRLVPPDLPARLVPARGEGALYRRIAALAHAPDTAIAAAASRYGPLGPLGPVSTPIADPQLFMWAVGELFRQYVLDIDRLGPWIDAKGKTPIPGHLAPTAHLLAALAETDLVLAQRLLDLFAQDGPSELPDEERQGLAHALEVQVQVLLHAWGQREHLLSEQVKESQAYVRVIPKPGTGRYLALAARYLQVAVAEADEVGTTAAQAPPDSLGRVATMLQPYLDDNLIPPENVSAWREAATELQRWANILRATRTADPPEISPWKALLTLRLQQTYAWRYPSGQQLGAFGRALWTVWTRLVQQPPQRRCTWPDQCPTLLPPDAHGNRRYCDAHRREAARQRSARSRQQARAG
jgi:hypothetical protein